MSLQCPNLTLGILVGIVVFSFTIVTKVQTDNQPQIRARVVHADGTPLVNTEIYVLVAHRDLDARGGGSSGNIRQTDAEGYFVEALRENDEDVFYVLGVAFQGHLAKSWYAVGPSDLFWDITKWATIEKPNVFDNSPIGEE